MFLNFHACNETASVNGAWELTSYFTFLQLKEILQVLFFSYMSTSPLV